MRTDLAAFLKWCAVFVGGVALLGSLSGCLGGGGGSSAATNQTILQSNITLPSSVQVVSAN